MIQINKSYDWKITAKKFLIYGLMALSVAYLILSSLPQSAKIGVALGVIMALINFIKNSGVLKPEEMPIIPTTKRKKHI